jgi:DNA-binding transcriptional ArsR family regulator
VLEKPKLKKIVSKKTVLKKAGLEKAKRASKVDQELASRRFKILGDKNRLSIFKFLMKKPCPVGDLALALGIGRTLVSHNLKILRAEGLVAAKRFGKSIVYTISEDLIVENNETIDLDCCKVSFSQ